MTISAFVTLLMNNFVFLALSKSSPSISSARLFTKDVLKDTQTLSAISAVRTIAIKFLSQSNESLNKKPPKPLISQHCLGVCLFLGAKAKHSFKPAFDVSEDFVSASSDFDNLMF